MITPASNPSLFAGTKPATTDRTGLGRDAFLQLLVTQLKHQDPLSPLQPHEFAAQLAQFSSVEQLEKMNSGIEGLANTGALSALLGKTTFGASLLGKSVVAAGDQVVIPPSGPASVRVEIGAAGGTATLRLLDAGTGAEVARRGLGTLPGGRQTLALPTDLPPGTYRYAIDVAGPEGASVPVKTYATGVAEGVYFRDGAIVIRIGGLDVPLDDVTEIEATK